MTTPPRYCDIPDGIVANNVVEQQQILLTNEAKPWF
jgi:hypothetical protein